MAESSSKRQRKAEENNGGGIDRMSSLPDSVLLQILSFLPTKTSVATMSLVSRRYRHLWKHLQVFDFSEDNSEDFKRFAFFVNAVLALRKSRDIRKMHLFCDISDEDTFPADSVDTWVRAAIGPHLEELSLSISLFNCMTNLLILPPTLFNCTNLVSLSLSGAIHVNVQHSSAVHFPSLKVLKLGIITVDSLDALLSGCPILETLDIAHNLKSFIVPPSLKRLDFAVEDHIELQIDTPGLKYLSITTTGGTFDAGVGNLQNVVEAYIDVCPKSVKPLLKLLRALSGIKNLVLDCSATKKSNMLQVLTIQSYKEASPLRTWEPQSTRVPNCFVSHLTYIHIKGYQGFEDELAFAEYILRNGLVLKTMIIVVDFSLDLGKKYCILKRLSDIPRGSVTCQLKFD